MYRFMNELEIEFENKIQEPYVDVLPVHIP